MRHFTNVHDIGDLQTAVREALEVKANRFAYKRLGENRTLMMIFFNSSLRTRLSTQKLHARGPMALPELTTYKYIISGNGQTRE